MFLWPTSESEIIATYTSLKNSTATDNAGLQIKPVKFVIGLIAPCLTHIINSCISCAVFPRRMQCAKVTAIYKKGDKNDLGNYRPLSILPAFSKGFEKIISARLVSFTDCYSILTDSQYGFRKDKSTELALLTQKEIILEMFESQNFVLGIFLDFTKAFDLINDNILNKKLEHYAIRGKALLLISSYLQHRSQFVMVNGHYSSIKPVNVGVPQGSILGPFLFVLYINDIVNIDPTAKHILYADDTSLFFAGSDVACLSDREMRHFIPFTRGLLIMN